MTIREAQLNLTNQLKEIYDERESEAISDWVMESLTGLRKIDRIIGKNEVLDSETEASLSRVTIELLQHKPVQYIFNQAWFMGMKLYVNESVLIPRPETEELVEWALAETRDQFSNAKILDVGTGSGCIPIALKKELPGAKVYGCDISKGALEVAKRNAELQVADIHLILADFLNENERSQLPVLDIIISNPPYIAFKEKSSIDKHVIEYEPHDALFVPTNNSMVFYQALASFGKQHLAENGIMFLEIHSEKGDIARELFEKEGYEVELKKDLNGNQRMIKVKQRSQAIAYSYQP